MTLNTSTTRLQNIINIKCELPVKTLYVLKVKQISINKSILYFLISPSDKVFVILSCSCG